MVNNQDIGVFKVFLVEGGIKIEFEDHVQHLITEDTMTMDERRALLSITMNVVERLSQAMVEEIRSNMHEALHGTGKN